MKSLLKLFQRQFPARRHVSASVAAAVSLRSMSSIRSRRTLLIAVMVALTLLVGVTVVYWNTALNGDGPLPVAEQHGFTQRTTDQRISAAAHTQQDEYRDIKASSRVVNTPMGSIAIAPTGRWANNAANRSPLRPVRPLEKNADGGTLPDAAIVENTAMCFDRTGGTIAVPKWFPELYRASRDVYHSLRSRVQDPWQVLIGWVPSKFMGPQKPGRKANGDIMIPPTKGRNASVYWEMYNASWHHAVEANGYPYQFQLAHRNALAVCIRERLHVFQLYCSPGPKVEPLIVYHCPCRHCREGSLKTRANGATLSQVFPNYESHLLRENAGLGEMKLITSGPLVEPKGTTPDGCVEDLAAPWLLTKDVVPRLPYEGLEHNLDKLLVVQADVNKIVMVVIFNKFWIDHLHNFVFSMVTKARLVNYVVATMDEDALHLCLLNRLPCFDATEYAEFEQDMVVGGAGHQKGHTRKVSEAMSWIKPRLAVAVLRRGFGFFMSDLDLTWNKPPWKDILDVRVDIAHQCDSNNKFSINSGFYFARANARTIRFFENVMVLTPEENSDQTAMKLFAKYDHTHGASNTCLYKWAFNMKCNYKIDNSVKVVNGVETFEWKPYDASNVFWTILHATCLAGAQAKMQYLRTVSAWRLDDLDAMTDKGKEYCVVLHNYGAGAGGGNNSEEKGGTVVSTVASFVDQTTAKRVKQRNIATAHSSKYDMSVSSVFLQKRH